MKKVIQFLYIFYLDRIDLFPYNSKYSNYLQFMLYLNQFILQHSSDKIFTYF